MKQKLFTVIALCVFFCNWPLLSWADNAANPVLEATAPAPTAPAPTATQKTANKTVTSPLMADAGSYTMQVLLGLMFVIAMIFVAAWVMKRVGRGSFMSPGNMQVLSSMSLGTRERVALVDVAGQQILLGITPTNITTLHTFEQPAVIKDDNTQDIDFASRLKDILARGVPKS